MLRNCKFPRGGIGKFLSQFLKLSFGLLFLFGGRLGKSLFRFCDRGGYQRLLFFGFTQLFLLCLLGPLLITPPLILKTLFFPISQNQLLHDNSPLEFSQPCVSIGRKNSRISERATILIDNTERIPDSLFEHSVVVALNPR